MTTHPTDSRTDAAVPEPVTTPGTTSSCCSRAKQSTCCDASEKSDCCGVAAGADDGCRCQ